MSLLNGRKPCGVEPYDKEFTMSYTDCERNEGADELSPYARINRMRARYFAKETYDVDHHRAWLLTEAYKANEAQPQPIKCAEGLAHILRCIPIHIAEDELIVGESGTPSQVASVYPEHSFHWVVDELRNFPWEKRPYVQYHISEESKQKLFELEDYWKDRSIDEVATAMMSYDQKKGSSMGKQLFHTSLYLYGGIGHYVANYPRLLSTGFGKLRGRVQEKLDGLDLTLPENVDKKVFYRSELIVLDAVRDFILRYADLAAEMAEKETRPDRKAELLQISANCRKVSTEAPETFWEALQLWLFITHINHIETNGHSVSYGRMDQYLYPFYEHDIENGVITQDFAQELLEVIFIKTNEPFKIKNRTTIEVSAGRTFGGENLIVGGVDTKGNDATNDLTFMILDACAHTRMRSPWLAVRFHANTPRELKVKTINVARAGFGHPKVFNDEILIPMHLQRYGQRTMEQARDYSIVGCVEPDTAGFEYGWHDAAYFSVAKVFELAINDGRCLGCSEKCPNWAHCGSQGRQLGPHTGSLADFTDFSQVKESFEKQMKYWTDICVSAIEIVDNVHQKLKPLPYLSLLIDDCIEKGKDVSCGGARYNHTGPQAIGLGTVADGLSTIRQLIFDEKRITGAEMLKALEDNWVGHEPLYALVNSDRVHHYGNDDDYADSLAAYVMETYCNNINGRPNSRGGTYEAGVYSVIANVGFGVIQWASPDGRVAGEPLSDNIGPVHTHAGSHDVKGPTAIAKSATKIDHSLAGNGTLLNWKFSPSSVSGETGRENFINLVDTFFQLKGLHSQFSIVSRETLEDALVHPENYKDLLVRVAGYSAYFTELSPVIQRDLIERTELSFD